MTAADILAGLLPRVPLDGAMQHIERLIAEDRYQASAGIERAAAYVAEAAHAYGLADVSLLHETADGRRAWWSFCAPVSWTPVVARAEILADAQPPLVIDHAAQPFSVATYSAPTAGEFPIRRLEDGPAALRGAIALVSRAECAGSDIQQTVLAAGARGFITDAPSRDDAAGRIELDPRSPLFAFSVAPGTFDTIFAMRGARARVAIRIDDSAPMPVVTGVIPGRESAEEVWLLAHLCHPRPGANDNASGVAALLAAAAALASSGRTGRTVRIVCGPEYLGTAALLHRLRDAPLPHAAINLDMVGEDPVQCASPFVLERAPDTHISPLNAIAENVVGETFAAIPGVGTWHAVPFMGFSDHALFAPDGSREGAVQFCHPADRFNHSAADTLSKVSRTEMLRATAAAAALAHIAGTGDAMDGSTRARIVEEWCARELAAAMQAAAQHRSVNGGAWAGGLLAYTRTRNEAVLATLSGEAGPRTAPAEAPVLRRWEGPMNVRAMLKDAPPRVREAAQELIRTDKRNYAMLLNFCIRADGTRDRTAIIDETSYSWHTPLDPATAAVLFDVMLDSGWAALHSTGPAFTSERKTHGNDQQHQGT